MAPNVGGFHQGVKCPKPQFWEVKRGCRAVPLSVAKTLLDTQNIKLLTMANRSNGVRGYSRPTYNKLVQSAMMRSTVVSVIHKLIVDEFVDCTDTPTTCCGEIFYVQK